MSCSGSDLILCFPGDKLKTIVLLQCGHARPCWGVLRPFMTSSSPARGKHSFFSSALLITGFRSEIDSLGSEEPLMEMCIGEREMGGEKRWTVGEVDGEGGEGTAAKEHFDDDDDDDDDDEDAWRPAVFSF